MTTSTPTRRGVALLMTLAAIVIAVVACASLARVAVTTSLARSIDSKYQIAADLLHAADNPIRRWLRERGPHVVLPPESNTPGILVLDEFIDVGSDTTRLTITAWDQRGMASPSLLVRGSPMRSALPRDVLDRLDEAQTNHGDLLDHAPGLDLFDTPESPFPTLATDEPTRFGRSFGQRARHVESRDALGAFIATHNTPPQSQPTRRRRSRPQPAINVNTAPIDLVESAMRMAGRRGIDQVVEARRRGEPARIGGSVIGQPLPNAPSLTATSDVWSIRIDATIGSLTRSWWAVYTKDQGSWRCVQRLAIDR